MYEGKINNLCNGLKVVEKSSESTKFEVDENIIPLAKAISFLTDEVKVVDLEVENTSIDDMVVKLYEEYKI